MAGEKAPRAFSIEELPGHLVGEVPTSGRLAAADLARLEATCRASGRTPIGREQSSGTVETSSGSMQVATGRYHTLLVHDSSVYSCGSSLCGVLGHGPDTTQCVAFSRVTFPSLSRVINISASHTIMLHLLRSLGSGENNISTNASKSTSRDFLQAGCYWSSFTVILATRDGQVYTCIIRMANPIMTGPPKIIELFEGPTQVVQIAAGASYTFAVTDDGTVHSFGSCTNFCLGHGDSAAMNFPSSVRVSVEMSMLCLLTLWDTFTLGQRILWSLRYASGIYLVHQSTYFSYLLDGYFGSLGFPDRQMGHEAPCSREPTGLLRIPNNLRLYHTVAVTSKGIVFGFGDNERAQLGQEYIRGCLKPTEIMFQKSMEDIAITAPS
ncbi:hypothetical protein U9M48_012706, partial [Paspalum notatum var. saurae]